MVEIFNYGQSVYDRYAATDKSIKTFQNDLHFETNAIRDVAKHTQILNFTPTRSAMSVLLGTDQKSNWAKFSPPTRYFDQRVRSPYLIPSLGSPQKQDEDIQKIHSYLDIITRNKDRNNEDSNNPSKDEQENNEHENLTLESEALIKMLESGIKSTNLMIDYVISRIFQFVQG